MILYGILMMKFIDQEGKALKIRNDKKNSLSECADDINF